MQTKTQRYYATLFQAKKVCNTKCERCKVALDIAEAGNHVVLMAEKLYIDKYGNVKAIDTHALLSDDDKI